MRLLQLPDFAMVRSLLVLATFVLSGCLGFNICLEDRQGANRAVFEAALTACKDCHYAMDLIEDCDSFRGEDSFALNPDTGTLKFYGYLPSNYQNFSDRFKKICVHVTAKSKLPARYGLHLTRLNVTLVVPKQDCRSLKALSQGDNGIFSKDGDLAVKVMWNSLTVKPCFQLGAEIVKLADYMPFSLRKSCELSYGLQNSSKIFYLDPVTGDVIAVSHFCVSELLHTLDFTVALNCPVSSVISGMYHIRFILIGREKPGNDDKPMKKSGLNQANNFRDRSRYRRAARNRAPSFPVRQYFQIVPEEVEAGYVFATITANDPDQGEAGRLTYSLLATKDGRSQTMFAVDPDTGVIRTTKRLDRETMAEHYFRLIAKDSGKPSQSAEALLTIHVKDINDHKPVFESARYSEAVSEGIGIGTTILTVRASDEDSEVNGDIEYSILNQQEVGNIFEIDPYSGSITTKAMIDREQQGVYRLEILATDSAQDEARQTATAIVEIIILDENDNRPQFSNASYVVEVREDIDFTRVPVITRIHASDADAGNNGVVRYSIIGGNLLNTFTIDSTTGELAVAAMLDYEKVQAYLLNVRAQDNGSPPRSNTTTVLVRVLDVNDNDPKFDMPFYQESVLENIPVGKTILRLRAYDADLGLENVIEYSVKEAIEGMPIAVNSTTGAVYTVAVLDREQQSHYQFQVEARDHGVPRRTATATVEITVRDVNDNAPVFNPSVYHEVVSEEALPGMPVVTVTAQDADENENARITYAIKSGNDLGSFNIISQMGYGLISIAQALSYKQQSRYVLVVTASDSSHNASATVFINISDANLHRPIFVRTPYNFRIKEDTAVGAVVYNVSAVDQDSGDNAKITYTMQENKEFTINPDSGEVILQQVLDREQVTGYMLTVTATDHGHPQKSDTTDIEVMVLDVNDNAPKFLAPSYSGRVDEDAQIGTSILVVSAVDLDALLNGRIRYTFDGGDSGNEDFMIDPTLGIIRTAKELDRERTAEYNLRLFAVDRGDPEHSTSVGVTIVVDDVNDNAPQFLSSNILFFINENSPIGSTVGVVIATDQDQGANAEIEYTISGGPDMDSFLLTTEPQNLSAVITTLTDLDFEGEKKEYKISVRARSFHLFSDATVKILVQDVNDNIPQLKDFVIVFNNYKDFFHSGHVGRIPAFDPDVSDKLQYRFISGNQANLLHLDEDTGFVRLDSRLNSDLATNGTLKVSVTDGINEVRAMCRLYVRLVTEEMLMNSITVRLKNIRQSGFLSPLYNLFMSSLASIIPTVEENVFIINVLDDTDVSETILNVTFSVRQKVDHGQDVFYSQQFLREKVYLQRVLLARLSNLEVLPFDDNLCIREPCLNFEECYSVLRFGNTSAAVGSDMMLFRPIIPANTFSCKCPRGFTGMDSEYLCDTEVNLCYSSPCGGNGTCIQKEGGYHCICEQGFTGLHCETDVNHANYEICPRNVCRPPSRCVPRIRGGFRCELCGANGSCVDCASLDAFNEFCELRVRSFSSDSYLMFMPMRQRHRFNITLSIATRDLNSLLFYNGRYNEKHDFVALEVINGQVQFSFSLGSEVVQVRTQVEGGVNDGAWRRITVYYLNRTATVTVGDGCDSELSIRHGHKIGNYHCAGQATQVLEDRCRDVTETCHRFLDLSGPFHLGGISSLSSNLQITNRHFVGCIRDLYIDSKFIDLNSFAWQNGTGEGCAQKNDFCKSSPCQNSGSCQNGWDSYMCDCHPNWTGKDCSQRAADGPWKLFGAGALLYTKEKHGLSSVQLPWCNGLSFRTRQANATLMTINLGAKLQDSLTGQIVIEIVNGYLHYINPQKTVVVDNMRVNDGHWHYMETRWLHEKLVVTVDYGQIQVTKPVGDWVTNRAVGTIVVGGQTSSNVENLKDVPISNGLDGCVKAIRVGVNLGFLLTCPDHFNAELGCNVTNVCSQKDACPKNTTVCVNNFGTAECTCRPGRVGPNCQRICDRFSPCEGGQCIDSPQSATGYFCKCDASHTGRYCMQSVRPSCPASWWSTPICGPCNCPKEKGFDPNCNKTTGQCNCRANHYRVGDACYPCDCYEVGSHGRACNLATGQCTCRSNVIGRQCDACGSKFAEVTLRGCEVIYDACPRTFRAKVWWERTPFGSVAQQSCPENMQGVATRVCNETEGWHEPNLEDCTSAMFVDLRQQLSAVEENRLVMNTFVAKGLIARLSLATRETQVLYEMDIRVTLRLLIHVLRYESKQSGLNLTHTQDRSFIQHLVNSIGEITDAKYSHMWMNVNQKLDGWAAELMRVLSDYVATLARNMPSLFTQPFDVVHKNIVMGLDYIGAENQTDVSIPKYNNKVQNPDMFDTETKAFLPVAGLRQRRAAVDSLSEFRSSDQQIAFVGYVMYKTIGDLLPNIDGDSVRMSGRAFPVVNSLVFTLAVVDRNEKLRAQVEKPIVIELRQLSKTNRSNPQCVHWTYGKSGLEGYWSTEGCELKEVKESASNLYVTCECDQLTTFAVLMDVGESAEGEKYQLYISTYVVLSLALALFAGSLLFYCLFGQPLANANSIRIHLVGCLFASNLVFLIGIDKVEPLLACKIVAIALHFTFLCSFMWLFIKILHNYRRMTDIQDVNYGTMGFYYVIGYVFPGIIVTLAVALNADGYGSNKQFCWLKMEPLMWSLAGPVSCVIVFSIAVSAITLCVVCRGGLKHSDSEMSYLRYNLRADFIYLPLQSLAWLFALLTVNNGTVSSFHYLFLIFTFLQAAFIVIAFIILNKEMKIHIRNRWFSIRHKTGKEDMEDTHCITRSSHYSRSGLSIGSKQSSYDNCLNTAGGRSSKPTSPSHCSKKLEISQREKQYSTQIGRMPSTSKGLLYGADQTAGISAFLNSKELHNRTESDSDSDTSAVGDMELASSHSSDNEDPEYSSGWKGSKSNGTCFADVNSEPGGSGRIPSVSGSSSALPHPQKIYVRVVKHDTDISSSDKPVLS